MKRIAICLLICFLSCCAPASAQNEIATVAGGTVFTFPANVTIALNAPLGRVTSVAADAQGNVYVADAGNRRIFQVSAGGNIQIVAGNGTTGFSGDGGPATSASLSYPYCVAVDASGDLFIADFNSNRIRKVSAGGIITTVAGTGIAGSGDDGGPATSAALNQASGVAVDASGDLFIADGGNNRIRKVSPSGIITTVAGTGAPGFSGDGGPATSASLNDPVDVAVDASGNLFIADYGNSRIRKVSTGGIVTTVAGNGRFNLTTGDGGPATSASVDTFGVAVDASGNLFIADGTEGRIREVSASGIITTVAGPGPGTGGFSGDGGPATAASLGQPNSVAVDASGNLFIADTTNYRIRKVAPSGIITTLAGNGNYGFSGDGGPATAASLNLPVGAAVDATGDLFIADFSNNRIRRVAASGIITTVAGNGTDSFSGDGGPATAASLWGPRAVAVDASGNLFIIDAFNNRIREVSSNGIITTVAAMGGTGIAVDGSGNLFIADGSAQIWKVAAGGIITSVAGNGKSGFSGDGGQATSASLNGPWSVAVDSSGDLFIADSNNNRIRKVSASGIITTLAGNGARSFSGDGGPATSASLNDPMGIAVDSIGDVVISDSGNGRIRKVTPGGIISTAAGNGTGFFGDGGPAVSAGLNSPWGVAVDSSGDLFIADSNNNRIREVSVAPLSLSVNPTALYLSSQQGYSTQQSQSIQIGGAAGTAWQATATTSTGGAWLSISPSAGQIPASLTVQANPGSLPAGNYQGSITVLAPGATPSSITFSVSLGVYFVPPYVNQISNAASGHVAGQNRVGIAQGSLFVLDGGGLGPAALQQSGSFPIPLALAGTSVQINMSGGTYNAPIISTSDSEVIAILPSLVPAGRGTLVVTYNGNSSYPISFYVDQSAFGIYTLNSDGAGPGVIQDVNSVQLTFTQPGHTGDTVTLLGTGLGPVNGDETAGTLPGNLFTPEVFVGDQPATVQYAGRTQCCAGQDQIIFQIPSGVQGCFVPLAVRNNGVVSNFVSLPIAPAGEACSDPVGFTPDLVTKAGTGTGLNAGGIALGPIPVLQSAGFSFTAGLAERLSAMLGTKITEQELRTIIRASHSRRTRALRVVMKKYEPILKAKHIDASTLVSMANALNYPGVSAGFQQGTSPIGFSAQVAAAFPPPGTCTAGSETPYQSPGSGASHQGDDAGPQLLLTGPAGTQTLNRLSNGEYQLSLAPGSTNFSFPSGTYFVTSNGGNDVGAFSASLQIGSPLTWTNKASVGFIDRSEPLTITWSGGPPSGYVVFGGAGSTDDGLKAAFSCVADVRDQTLTVPDYVLATMPHTSNGSVFLAAHPLQNLFSAPGIDVGFFADLTNDAKSIGFQ